jgi:prolyl-tRNA synthetase
MLQYLSINTMRQSQLFTKTRREAPKDEVAKNAELLIRAGFIHKELAGVYSYLPLGLRVLNNIVQVIREEMNAIGGQELYLTALQDPAVWKKSGRWDDASVDNWFKTKLKNDSELGLGFTHEEPLTNLMKDYVSSFRDLPFSVYQFQTKFRNEARAKSGIMRTREFLMKDLYSFNLDEKGHVDFYEKAKQAYVKIFERLGLGEKTFITFASGGSFSKYSHEFQTLSDDGEDMIYVDEKKKIAVNKEVLNDEVLKDLGLNKKDLVEKKAVEVGNIFSLGTRFSDAFDLKYLDSDGKKKPVVMGSYGIGPGRVMGVMAETMSDEHGLVWPKGIAPFDVHLVVIFDKEGTAKKEADALYDELVKKGISVLYDDRDLRPGEKFADSDLIGIPTRIVVSEKNLKEGKLEVKDRKSGEVKMISKEEVFKRV